jgi:hypothetical protein
VNDERVAGPISADLLLGAAPLCISRVRVLTFPISRFPLLQFFFKKNKKAGWSIRPFLANIPIGCGGQI